MPVAFVKKSSCDFHPAAADVDPGKPLASGVDGFLEIAENNNGTHSGIPNPTDGASPLIIPVSSPRTSMLETSGRTEKCALYCVFSSEQCVQCSVFLNVFLVFSLSFTVLNFRFSGSLIRECTGFEFCGFMIGELRGNGLFGKDEHIVQIVKDWFI